MKLGSAHAAIVTGGASGLGEATVRRLRSREVKVAILDVQKDRGEAIARETGALFCFADVTSEDSVTAALERARKAHGAERLLVTCAGVAPARRIVTRDRAAAVFQAHDLTLFAKTVAINLVGTFCAASHCAQAMCGLPPIDEDGQRGLIVMTSSVAAQDGQIGQTAYAASKGGVAAMTLPMARDLSASGIRVMTILPGLFATPMFDGLPDAAREALAVGVPFPSRLGRPDEYALLVEAICENDMLNGAAIRLDGAIRLPPK